MPESPLDPESLLLPLPCWELDPWRAARAFFRFSRAAFFCFCVAMIVREDQAGNFLFSTPKEEEGTNYFPTFIKT